MTRPTLTIILFRDAEKGPEYLELYLGALREWNRAGLDRAGIILVSQAADSSDVHAICARQPFRIHVVHPCEEIVDGCPIWDALAAVRLVWPLVRGRYVTVHHTEFIWGPDRLAATMDWLERVRPYYAIGNLRRPGSIKEISNPKVPTDCVRSVSESVAIPMLAGDWAEAARQFESIPTTHWM